MSEIKFHARWKEELLATSEEGTLIFELTIGTLHVYFPDQHRWPIAVPAWVKKNGKPIAPPARNGAGKTRSSYRSLRMRM